VLTGGGCIPTDTKVEGKKAEVPLYAMKAYMGNRGIAALILDLGTRWR
jgi:hypothetical protein